MLRTSHISEKKQEHKKRYYTVGGRHIARVFHNFWGQMFADCWHNLYIRRLPAPSPRPLEGFQSRFFEVLQTLRRNNLPEKKHRKKRIKTV